MAKASSRPILGQRQFSLALLVALAVSVLPSYARAPVATIVREERQVALDKGWRFKPDPGNVGLGEGWARSGFNDRGWALVDAGKPWEEQGFDGYDGFAWYRRAVTIPAAWSGLPAYLWLAGIDDEADVFVNGTLIGHFGDRDKKQSSHRDQLSLDVGSIVRAGSAVVVAVRVSDWGGIGGLTMRPAAVATSAVTLLSDDRYIRYQVGRNPDLPWPYWLVQNSGEVKPQGAAWTMLGSEGGASKSLLGLDSSVMASQEGFALTPWLFDRRAHRLDVPDPSSVTFGLAEGYLPVASAEWTIPGLTISSTLFVSSIVTDSVVQRETLAPSGGPASDALFYRLSVLNNDRGPRDLSLYFVLRPYGVAGRVSKVYSLAMSGSEVLVNGGLGLVADQAPDAFGATSSGNGDIGFFVKNGELPTSSNTRDERGLASGAFVYNLLLEPGRQATLSFKMPVTPTGDSDAAGALRRLDFTRQRTVMADYWRNRLAVTTLSLPDETYANAYYASLANMLMARNGDLLLPGPLAHRHFWYRDAAYLSLALLAAGRSDIVRPLLDKAMAGQLPSGEFPPILEPDGRPSSPEKHEWDAQGEGIFALVSYYRWTRDEAWLSRAYPTIRRAAAFLRDLRGTTQRPELAGTPRYGILPPSESAEDLGPAEWHHYWDDFWGLTGLRDAAFAAKVLGQVEDARWIDDEEAKLRAALLESIDVLQRLKGIDYIPNGPEDTDTSAMARGTTPALWPSASFDPRGKLLRRSFDRYFERWLAPYGGAYRHEGDNYWPYGGLQLAHVYLLLGMTERVQTILDWTLSHQTLPGLYAWAESVQPASNRFAGGDMPHAWAAAEYTLLLRDMLVREDENRLRLASYVPRAWLADGRRVAVSGMPTLFGPVGYALESHAAAGYWDLTITQGANPPGGYVLTLPASLRVERIELDGQDWSDFGPDGVRIPVGARSARLHGSLLSP